MKNLFMLFITLAILSSCTNKGDTRNIISPIDTTKTEISNIHQEDLDGVFTTPEDSMSIGQKELRQKILLLMKENIKLKDGRFMNNGSKEDFEKQGIPLTYYYLLEESIKDLNVVIEKDGVDAQKIYDEMMAEFSE